MLTIHGIRLYSSVDSYYTSSFQSSIAARVLISEVGCQGLPWELQLRLRSVISCGQASVISDALCAIISQSDGAHTIEADIV